MIRIRSKRRRPLAVEALEGRLALSSGMAIGATAHHAALAHVDQTTIKASFTGHAESSGSDLALNGLKGKIGTDKFTGSGEGTQSGGNLQSGIVNLSNSKGTISLGLAPGSEVKAGKTLKQVVDLEVVSATGKYASYLGATGIVTKFKVSPKPHSPVSIAAIIEA